MKSSRYPLGLTSLFLGAVITAGLLGTLTTPSRANHVHMQGGPFIGVVLSVAVDPVDSETLYCAAYGGGVFRSRDRGASWVAINRGLPDRQVFSLLLDPNNPSQLYVGTDQGIFHSTNKGDSWRLLSPVLKSRNIRAIAINLEDPKSLYAGTDQGVFQGQDGNWENVSKGLRSKDVRALVVSPQRMIYAGTFDGIFKKERREPSWASANNGLTDKKVRA